MKEQSCYLAKRLFNNCHFLGARVVPIIVDGSQNITEVQRNELQRGCCKIKGTIKGNI